MNSENYIYIYTSFLLNVFKTEDIYFSKILELMKEFEPVCEKIQTRKDLIEFIDTQLGKFPQLEILRERLMDANYVFPELLKEE